MTPESTICSDHFRPDQFVKNTNTLLKRTAVPCMKFLCEEYKELPNKYSEGHGLLDSNIPLLTEQNFSNLVNDQVRLCRLCALASEDYYLIFDKFGKEMKIAEKINLCLPLKVHITDPLPKQVCKSCYNELNELFEMADQCSISQKNILNLIEYNLKDVPFYEETLEVDNNIYEALCPLCLDGNLVCSVSLNSCNYENINSYHNGMRGLVCNDLYDVHLYLNEYNNISNSGHLSAKFDVINYPTSFANDSERKKEIDKFREPILTPGCQYEVSTHPIKEEQSSAPLSPIDTSNYVSIHDEYNSRCEKSHLPESDACSRTNCDSKIILEQLEKNSLPAGMVFICRICAQEFNKSTELLNHSYDHSCKNFYQCSTCVMFFKTKNELAEHIQEHISLHNINSYCTFCQECVPLLSGIHFCFKENKYSSCPLKCSGDSRSCDRLKCPENSQCSHCNKTFEDDLKLQKHFLYTHSFSKKMHCCEECGKVFKSEASMKYHQRTHQNNDGIKPYCCSRCGKCFMRKSMLINHMASSHSNTIIETSSITCKYCFETFPNTDAAVAHMDNVHKQESSESTTYSFEMQTVKRVFICEFCERCYVEDSILNTHREKHSIDTPYECKYCFKTFVSDEELNNHKLSHAKNKPAEYWVDFTLPKTYLCEYCERCFLSHVKYSEHLSIHFGPEPYKCRQCPLIKFQYLKDAVDHREKHGELLPEVDEYNSFRPYDCHYCNKRFAIEDALIKHIRMHTGEKPFICDQCGKGFSQSSGLYTHQKVHSTERPYSCSVCPRTFKIKGDRDVHVRKHSGDRPYKCEYCGKAFMTQHVYSQHKKIHTGERPYKCDVCGIAFRRSHVLTVHKRIHTGEKPNICHICGKSYRQKGDMLKHCRVQHGIVNSKRVLSPIISC